MAYFRRTLNPGYFSVHENQRSCQPCPAGTYSSAGTNASAPCLPCPPGQFSLGGASRCVVCATGTYAGFGWSTCLPCPSRLNCIGGLFTVEPGLWFNPATAAVTLPHEESVAAVATAVAAACAKEISYGANICDPSSSYECVAEALSGALNTTTPLSLLSMVSGVDIAHINDSAQFLPCPNPDVCVAICSSTIPTCAAGHTGYAFAVICSPAYITSILCSAPPCTHSHPFSPFCSQCQPGFALNQDVCDRCSEDATIGWVLTGLFFVLVGLYVGGNVCLGLRQGAASSSNSLKVTMKQLVNHFQIVSFLRTAIVHTPNDSDSVIAVAVRLSTAEATHLGR